MTDPVTPDGSPRCPFCGEDRLIEFVQAVQRWFCSVCGRTWLATDR